MGEHENAVLERLHAFDAVRAYALLLGVVLHSATVFLENFPVPTWRDEPSATAAVIYYVIRMFRMSAATEEFFDGRMIS